MVRKGYARNFLFPKNLAVYSTPLTRKQYAEAASKIDFEARIKRNKLIKARKRFKSFVLKIRRKKVRNDELYAPVDANTLCTQLWKQGTVWVTPELVTLPSGGLTSFGTHQVPVLLGESNDPEARSLLTVEIIPW